MFGAFIIGILILYVLDFIFNLPHWVREFWFYCLIGIFIVAIWEGIKKWIIQKIEESQEEFQNKDGSLRGEINVLKHKVSELENEVSELEDRMDKK
ncbi:MAG: hypothetical protein ABIG64_09040 [Candidatus Omnitrophota bacterium]